MRLALNCLVFYSFLAYFPSAVAEGTWQQNSRSIGLGYRGGAVPYPASGVNLQPSGLAKGGISRSMPSRTTIIQPQVIQERQTTDLKDLDSRVGFVRKVYGLLSTQLMLTLGIITFFQNNKAALLPFFMGPGGNALVLFSVAVSIITLLVFELRPSLQTRSPANFGLLGLFTLAQSIPVAVTTLMFTTKSVMLALGQTSAVTMGLSMYALSRPKHDLSTLGSLCGASLSLMFISAILSLVFGFRPDEVVVGAMGALIFSGFIVYDTRRMAEGQHPGVSLSSNQYVKGAMTLYMDVVNLFVYLLRLSGERER